MRMTLIHRSVYSLTFITKALYSVLAGTSI